MTNPTLDNNTKSELNAMLTTPLSAAELKKIKKEQLLVLVGNDALERAGAARVKPAPAPKTPSTLSDELALRPVERAPAKKKPAPKSPSAKSNAKAKGAGPATRKTSTRGTEDRIMQPVGKLADVKAITQGSKRHLLAKALQRGATLEHLMEVVGWNRSTTQSALRYDVGQMGLGCERKDGKYFLIMPKGLKRLPVVDKTTTRADALSSACK